MTVISHRNKDEVINGPLCARLLVLWGRAVGVVTGTVGGRGVAVGA